MTPARKYEVVETYLSRIGSILGLEPIVTVKEYRWKWLAHMAAFVSSGGYHTSWFEMVTYEIRPAKPKLRVIRGGLK